MKYNGTSGVYYDTAINETKYKISSFNFICAYNGSIYITNNGNTNLLVSWGQSVYYPTLRTPEFSLNKNGDFTIFLHNFHGWSYNTSVSEVSTSLEYLELTIEDYNGNTSFVNGLNLLALSDIQGDDDTYYYWQGNLNEIQPNLLNTTGRYKIILRTSLLEDVFCTKFYEMDSNQNSVNTNSARFAIYEEIGLNVDGSTGTGSLFTIDSDNDFNGGGEGGEGGEVTPNPNQGIEDRLDEQNKKLDDLNDSIKEQNETSKGIFQTLLDLPRKTY